MGDDFISLSLPCSDLEDVLLEAQQLVQQVTLGHWGVWCALLKDGSVATSPDLPVGLYHQLHDRRDDLPKPVYISMGPRDEVR